MYTIGKMDFNTETYSKIRNEELSQRSFIDHDPTLDRLEELWKFHEEYPELYKRKKKLINIGF